MERDSVSRIEIGTRFVTDYELVVLARVLNVSLEWLTEQNENKYLREYETNAII